MIADIFITTFGRPELLERSLRSFKECTLRSDYRLTIVHDGYDPLVEDVLSSNEFSHVIDHVITHRENMGLGPSINQALSYIQSLNSWNEDERALSFPDVTQLTCYCQDDLLYTQGWLQRLSRMFLVLEAPYQLGFASGIECVEHPIKRDLGNGLLLKDWIRAAQMLARRSYWNSMLPIPRFDPETRAVRARPNDGVGSGVDWHFIRNHERSVCRSGRTNLVIPGLVKHLGYRESTWLKRSLPESIGDQEAIERARPDPMMPSWEK